MEQDIPQNATPVLSLPNCVSGQVHSGDLLAMCGRGGGGADTLHLAESCFFVGPAFLRFSVFNKCFSLLFACVYRITFFVALSFSLLKYVTARLAHTVQKFGCFGGPNQTNFRVMRAYHHIDFHLFSLEIS